MKPSSYMIDLADYRNDTSLPVIKPTHSFAVPSELAGAWTIAGDLDCDGTSELVQARLWQENDTHAVAAVTAYRLDGTRLWNWGNPAEGIAALHSDVPCQIYDWNKDGRQEVVIVTREHLIALDGATGEEIRRFATPSSEAADCLTFANLTDSDEADILLKTRYHKIWAFTSKGKLLWHVENPGGMKTAHQAYPVDLNGDGFDEIIAGYGVLDRIGNQLWALDSAALDLGRGHLDCVRILQRAEKPQAWRLVMTCCGDEALLCVNGCGDLIWERRGKHFESVRIGRLQPGSDEKIIVLDIDHAEANRGPLQVYDSNGNLIGEINTIYSRQHPLIQWTDDPADRIVACEERMLVSGATGKPLARFATPLPDHIQFEQTARNTEHAKRGEFHLLGHTANLLSEGKNDLLLSTNPGGAVWIYKNPGPAGNAEPGMPRNVTLY